MSDLHAEKTLTMTQILATTRTPRRRWRVWAGVAVLLCLLLGAGFAWWWQAQAAKQPRYVTAALSRGDLTVTVTATGTLQPINTVDVGSEISGTISGVFVDFNDRVKKGQVLAQLDTTKLQTALDRLRATLAANQARVLQVRATQEEAQQALARFEDLAKLSGGKVPSATELDAARAKRARAQADLATAEASVNESMAAVRQGESDLGKATIRSATNGIVLKRSVEPGQTVAASLQAPVLFSLAEDLREMELVVAVAEADVGKVKEGMAASFTVDAWPERRFPARIRQVRFAATTVDNVVSYQTVLLVKNADMSLRPGMTATADIKVAEHKEVLLAPNAALRFKPAEPKAAASGGLLNLLIPRPQERPKPQLGRGSGEGRSRAKVWVQTPQGLASRSVKTLLSDGRMTEIESAELQAGDAVVVDVQEPAK